jgi:predicted metal-binding protein
VSARVELIACETCGGSADRETHGSTRGERLIAQLRAAGPTPGVALSSVRCLWACSRSCAVHLRSEGRVGYVLAELEPDEVTAKALLEYAAMYGQTTDGAVPFKTWPQALRGHFLCRLPVASPPAEIEDTFSKD